MKIDWKNELSEDMYFRLCECRNLESDIEKITKDIKSKKSSFIHYDSNWLVLKIG